MGDGGRPDSSSSASERDRPGSPSGSPSRPHPVVTGLASGDAPLSPSTPVKVHLPGCTPSLSSGLSHLVQRVRKRKLQSLHSRVLSKLKRLRVSSSFVTHQRRAASRNKLKCPRRDGPRWVPVLGASRGVGSDFRYETSRHRRSLGPVGALRLPRVRRRGMGVETGIESRLPCVALPTSPPPSLHLCPSQGT